MIISYDIVMQSVILITDASNFIKLFYSSENGRAFSHDEKYFHFSLVFSSKLSITDFRKYNASFYPVKLIEEKQNKTCT